MAKLSNSPLDKRHRPASLLVSRFGFLEFGLQLFDGGEIPPQVRRQACGQAILRHANGLRGIVKRVFSWIVTKRQRYIVSRQAQYPESETLLYERH